MADTCHEMLFLAVGETIMNLPVFFGKLYSHGKPNAYSDYHHHRPVPYFTAV